MPDVTIRFAQISDIHLGRSFGGGKLDLSASEAAQREKELHAALETFAETVEADDVDVCFMPGDLFNSETPAVHDIDRVIALVNRLAPRPVFICPGNHDSYSRTSVYHTSSALYSERPKDAPRWGDHVHLATSPEFTSVRIGDLHVATQAFHADTDLGASPLHNIPKPHDDALNVLFFHGSLILSDALSGTVRQPAPFTAELLDGAGYDYAAVGHYHAPGDIRTDDDRLLGAYAGSPLAMDYNDLHEHGFLIGSLSDSGAEVRRVRTDPRVIHNLQIDLTGITSTEALEAALQAVLADTPDEDIVGLKLIGAASESLDMAPLDALCERFFKCIVEDATEEEHDFDLTAPAPAGRDAASRLKAHMAARYRACGSEAERRRVAEATAYALDALLKGEVTLR